MSIQVEEVHQDVRGDGYDGWYNVWLLLSESPRGRPLVLLDPRATSQTERAWDGDRAFTFDGMRRGDAMLWRSNRVPHATAQPLLGRAGGGGGGVVGGGGGAGGGDGGGGGGGATDAAVAEEPPASWDAPARSSFDFRCICRAEGDPAPG